MADDIAERLREAEERIAAVSADVRGLTTDVRGTTGQGGLKHNVSNLIVATAEQRVRVTTLEETVDRAVNSLTGLHDKAQQKIDELRISAERSAAVSGERERVNQRWVAPVITALAVAALLGVGSMVMARGRSEEEVRAAAREAATEAVREIRVRLPTPPEAP